MNRKYEAGEDQLLTVREVARKCGRSEETVRRWIWSGKLPARKLGNQLFVAAADLEAATTPRIGEAVATYAPQRRMRMTDKYPIKHIDYDVEEALESLRRTLEFGRRMGEKYGPFDVTEALRRSRDEPK